jgi:hypothetical protein
MKHYLARRCHIERCKDQKNRFFRKKKRMTPGTAQTVLDELPRTGHCYKGEA